jgi:tRNA A37 methylthiotransferase MiaB
VNLGCPKNTVDSEGLLGAMALAGFAFAEDPARRTSAW